MDTSILSWTSIPERELLAELARDVPDNGVIVEIGCLYGGTTSVLALSASKNTEIISIDEFSWTPAGYPKATRELASKNLSELGIDNVKIIQEDSRVTGTTWSKPIDLLFIDGGHDFDFVYNDICNFAPFSKVVALHDYKNPHWNTIELAVKQFMSDNPEWFITTVVDTVVVLMKR